MRICHIINNLHVGGAEVMLLKLLSQLDNTQFPATVITLIECGPIGDRIRDLGVPVIEIGCRKKRLPSVVANLARQVVKAQPDLIQTWMYHANLFGGAVAKICQPRIPVVWNIRHSSIERGVDKRSTWLVAKMSARLSRRIPQRIVVNSQAGWDAHVDLGYHAPRMKLISNGFETNLFKPCREARAKVRKELGLSDEAPLVGMIGRFHPHKDHTTLIRAVAALGNRLPELRFVLCGDGVDPANRGLSEQIAAAGIAHRFHLLGRRDDVANIQAAIDLAVLSSCGEGFPNVLGEAMACGTPCVSTDVGDADRILGDTGVIVPPRSPDRMADAIADFFAQTHQQRLAAGQRARQRIVSHFSIEGIADQYAQMWQDVLAGPSLVSPKTQPSVPARRAA